MIYLGTAGWNVPASFSETIGGQGSHLERYARVQNAVEINSSFRRAHRRTTYEKWARVTPNDFRFAVKIPKALSHVRGLDRPHLHQFFDEVGGLGDKLAVLLVQFPPGRAFEVAETRTLFDAVRTQTSAAIVCEPRHASWFAPDVDRWLTERQISRVGADPCHAEGCETPGGWPGLRYYRLHGSPNIYYSAYDEKYLQQLSGQLLAEQVATWCIFDNTVLGAAFGNALFLRGLLPTLVIGD